MPFDKKDRQSFVAPGAGEHREEIRHRRRGDPRLLPIDQVAAIDLFRRCCDGRQVAARAGFGDADRADFLTSDRRLEQSLVNVVIAEGKQEMRAHQRLHSRSCCDRQRAAGDLFNG